MTGAAEGGAWWRAGAPLVAGVGVALALAGTLAGAGRMGALPSPGLPTVLAGTLGAGVAVGLGRSGLGLRLVVGLGLLALAGLAATPLGAGGVGVGLAFLAGPLVAWGSRVHRANGAGLLLLGPFAFALVALYVRVPLWLGRPGVMVGVLALAGIVAGLVPPLAEPEARGRFDVRAALAVATLVVAGFAGGLLVSQAVPLVTLPTAYGGAGIALGSGLGFIFVLGFVSIPFSWLSWVPGNGAWRFLLGLACLMFGLLLALAGGYGMAGGLLAIVPVGIAALLIPALARLRRVREGVGPAALVLASLFGVPLAAGIVRAFSRPLPGRIGINGGEVAARLDAGPVLLFYGALALVALLAHLAFVYEFGLAALAPEEGSDRLPILRAGFQKRGKTG